MRSRPSVGSLDASGSWSLIPTVEVTDTLMSSEVVKITRALLSVCPGSATQKVFGEECLVVKFQAAPHRCVALFSVVSFEQLCFKHAGLSSEVCKLLTCWFKDGWWTPELCLQAFS